MYGKGRELKVRVVVLIKGAGEVASGVAHRLFRTHLMVCMTEVPEPQAVSRGVAFCEAIYDGEKEVEGVVARNVSSAEGVFKAWEEGKIPLVVDPEASIREVLRPDILVDAIMAKRNLGTRITDAPLVIGLGPGFCAGRDVHVVVETNWSEGLGSVILKGEAEKDTGLPVPVDGLTSERVLHSPADGIFLSDKQLGDDVAAHEVVASLGEMEIKTEIGGIVRALLRSGVKVKKGTKLGEIDPSADRDVCFLIRGRVRAIAGGVLEAILMRFNT